MAHKADKVKKRRGRGAFASVTLLVPLLREVERVVEELGYWPNKTTFIREAVMQKLDKHRREIEARREAAGTEKSR